MLSALITIALGVVGWWVYIRFIRWFRQRSPEARERSTFKARLASWVKLVEMSVWVSAWLILMLIMFAALRSAYQFFHPNSTFYRSDDPWGYVAALSCGIITLPIAMLAANYLSWVIPSLRRANEEAMDGLPAASFKEANLGLLRFTLWAALLLLPLALVGLYDP
jgi:Na+/proline symporter